MEQRFSDLEPPPGPLKWYVPTKGYRWVTAESEGPFAGANRPEWEERRLCQPAGRSRDVTPYEPLEEPALFQRFAALPMTEEAVLAFANRYGWLGIAEPFSVNAKEPGAIRVLGGKKTQSVIWGERLGAWRTEAAVLQGVLELRDSPRSFRGYNGK